MLSQKLKTFPHVTRLGPEVLIEDSKKEKSESLQLRNQMSQCCNMELLLDFLSYSGVNGACDSKRFT